MPSPDFEMFDPTDQELPVDKQWGIIMGVPNYPLVRQEVVKWIIEPFVGVLKPVARACTGNVYGALIFHPVKWKGTSDYVRLWLFGSR